jgi:hypothetical protein
MIPTQPIREVPHMPERWQATKVSDVQPGDRVRTANGTEVIATRIEQGFLGRPNMVAFIEDTPQRWFKCPVTVDGEVEVLVADGSA